MTEISDLLYLRLEANVARHDEIRAMDFGLGLPSECAGEFFELPHRQAKLRAQWADALRAEGKKVDDGFCVFDAGPEMPPAGLRIANVGSAIKIYCYGIIGEDFTATDLQQQMERHPNTAIQLHINSEGGSVVDGTAIYSLIKSHAARVDVVVDALAASAASFMIMGADSIAMSLGSYMMIHYVSASLSNASEEDFAAATKRMKETNNSLKKFYLPRWTGTPAQLDSALLKEKYFSAEEAVSAGLADKIIAVDRVAACVSKNFPRESAPAELMIAARGGPSKFLNNATRQMTLHRIVTSSEN